MVRQLSIDQFENEGRRVSYGTPESATAARKLLDRQMSVNSVPKKVSFPSNTIQFNMCSCLDRVVNTGSSCFLFSETWLLLLDVVLGGYLGYPII